jgi:histone deacetylase complex regulatory component SIN3
VYSHVQFLFNGADDLLEEFKQFLPEITLQQPSPPSQPNKYGNGIKRHTSMHSNSSACSAMPSTKKKKASVSSSMCQPFVTFNDFTFFFRQRNPNSTRTRLRIAQYLMNKKNQCYALHQRLIHYVLVSLLKK